ncbi:MAG TPA: sigma-70 family RNA polymerase sigma factor [Vicinamibacteria bacterium]|nr:sigma-70 family RNA polymerase sigma factor [Vicinamibacteria bacterium]
MADRADQDRLESMWIARVVAHDDHEAFAELVRLHQSAVRRFLRRLTGADWSRADDLAQDTFLKAYRNIGGFQARGRFLSWLFRIAYQLFVTEQRRRRGVAQVPLPDDVPARGDASQRLADGRTFDQLMGMLRADERAALVLHYQHELTHPEVAEALELPLGTVKSLIRRGRLRLQEAHGLGKRAVAP